MLVFTATAHQCLCFSSADTRMSACLCEEAVGPDSPWDKMVGWSGGANEPFKWRFSEMQDLNEAPSCFRGQHSTTKQLLMAQELSLMNMYAARVHSPSCYDFSSFLQYLTTLHNGIWNQ